MFYRSLRISRVSAIIHQSKIKVEAVVQDLVLSREVGQFREYERKCGVELQLPHLPEFVPICDHGVAA